MAMVVGAGVVWCCLTGQQDTATGKVAFDLLLTSLSKCLRRLVEPVCSTAAGPLTSATGQCTRS